MDPALLYLGLAAVALVVFAIGALSHRPQTRACPGCGREVSVTAARCRQCGYRAR